MNRDTLTLLGLGFVSVLLGGCIEPDHGPLDTRLVDYEIIDPYHVSYTVSFHNTGDEDLTRIRIYLDPSISFSPGGAAWGNITGYPGKYETWRPAVFNHTDVLHPGEIRTVTLIAEFPEDSFHNLSDKGLTPAAYRTSARVEGYQDTKTRWVYNYYLPCLGMTGNIVKLRVCDEYIVFHEQEPE